MILSFSAEAEVASGRFRFKEEICSANWLAGSPVSVSDMLHPPSLERKPSFSAEVGNSDEFDANKFVAFGKAFVACWSVMSGRSSIASGLPGYTKPLPPGMSWTLHPLQVACAATERINGASHTRLHDGQNLFPRFT